MRKKSCFFFYSGYWTMLILKWHMFKSWLVNWKKAVVRAGNPVDAWFVVWLFIESAPLGRFDLVVAMSVCMCVCLCVCPFCPYMHLCICLPPLPEVGCPKFLEIRNPWGKVLERSGLRIEHFCLKIVENRVTKKSFFSPLFSLFFDLLRFSVFFNGLFAPTSRSRISNIFRDSESLGKSNGKKWSHIWNFLFRSGLKSPHNFFLFFFADFALQNMVETTLPDGLETSGRRVYR